MFYRLRAAYLIWRFKRLGRKFLAVKAALMALAAKWPALMDSLPPTLQAEIRAVDRKVPRHD